MKKIERSAKTICEIKRLLSGYKDYAAFSADRRAAFRFTELIGLRICPYCDIHYAYTVVTIRGKLVLRCDIDHFEAKSRSGRKQLQADNLVPSCQPCNSRLKLAKKFGRKTHLHPYFDSFDDIMVFSFTIKGANYLDSGNLQIVLAPRATAAKADVKRAEANVRDFCLRERYALHNVEAVDMLRKLKFYHGLRLEEIRRLTQIAGPLEWVLFGAEHGEINAAPLGKLKKDLFASYK